jgi:membrane protease YdiL (CAAX protease family)
MVAVGTFIAGKYLYKDSFKTAGWSWGKPKYYVLAIGLPLMIWIAPVLFQLVLGIQILAESLSFSNLVITFFLSFLVTIVPAFGEEFGWRGYLLPRLTKNYSIRKSLLIQSFIWWFWHTPFIIFMALSSPIIEGKTLLSVILMLGITIIPSMMHAIIFSYIWSISSSLAVVTVYYSMFDEIRDSLAGSIGINSVTNLWQMILITLLGLALLLRGKWQHLKMLKNQEL